MRGIDVQPRNLFSYVRLEDRVPEDHPLRALRGMVDVVLSRMNGLFDSLYSDMGRPSIAPEKLLRAQTLQILYTVRSERQLMEQIAGHLLSREHFCAEGHLVGCGDCWPDAPQVRPKPEKSGKAARKQLVQAIETAIPAAKIAQAAGQGKIIMTFSAAC